MAKLNALILTSNSYRHTYFCQSMAKYFEVVGVVQQSKQNYYSDQKDTSLAVRNHFAQLKRAEQDAMSSPGSVVRHNSLVVDDINAESTLSWIDDLEVDVVLLFGTSILSNDWLDRYHDKIVNLHLGLSPFYRGSATLFWPFYFDELHFLGTTIHLAVARVDAGAVLKRIQPSFAVGENYYQLTTNLIKKSIDEMPRVVDDYLKDNIAPYSQEHIPGRLCTKSHFSELALQRVLQKYQLGLHREELDRIEKKQCQYF